MDFADDALTAGRTITPTHVDAMMAELKRLGIRRVSWGWYGDGMGGMYMPGGYSDTSLSGWQHYADTFRALGGNPLKGAVTVEPAPCDFRDHNGALLRPAGRPVRVLTLAGFRLTNKSILVTSECTEGQPPDFINAGTKIVQAVDELGRVIPITVANGGHVW